MTKLLGIIYWFFIYPIKSIVQFITVYFAKTRMTDSSKCIELVFELNMCYGMLLLDLGLLQTRIWYQGFICPTLFIWNCISWFNFFLAIYLLMFLSLVVVIVVFLINHRYLILHKILIVLLLFFWTCGY